MSRNKKTRTIICFDRDALWGKSMALLFNRTQYGLLGFDELESVELYCSEHLEHVDIIICDPKTHEDIEWAEAHHNSGKAVLFVTHEEYNGPVPVFSKEELTAADFFKRMRRKVGWVIKKAQEKLESINTLAAFENAAPGTEF